MTSFDRAGWPRAIPALLTPFTDTGAVDLDAHAQNLRTVRTWGGSGILIAGSTGEGPYLEQGERASLIETTRRSDPTMLLIAGVHAESLRQATALIDECSDADAVLVVTPTSLVRGNTRAIEAFYVDLADRCRIPLLLYSVPSVTGYELPVDSVGKLSSHPNIVGMKDSGGEPSRLPPLAEATAMLRSPSTRMLPLSSASRTSRLQWSDTGWQARRQRQGWWDWRRGRCADPCFLSTIRPSPRCVPPWMLRV
jgi:dihydrodipicolinate synthase/N-acetylneuraminate lyase